MNERLQKIALEAELWAATNTTPETIDIFTTYDLFKEKFAELIVKECEKVSLNHSLRNDDMGAIIARQIVKHFGVE